MVEDPPPYPSPKLSAFLTTLSKSLPPVFFKPLFACTASDKEVIVVNHLCTLEVHSKYVTDYWLRDVEMMCVALMGNAGASSDDPGMPGQWGVARLGQLVLLVELIGKIQGVRHDKEAAANVSFRLFFVTFKCTEIDILLIAFRSPISKRCEICDNSGKSALASDRLEGTAILKDFLHGSLHIFFFIFNKGADNITATISTHAHLHAVPRVSTVDSIHETCPMVVQDVTMV
jgi:hypothetical protein